MKPAFRDILSNPPLALHWEDKDWQELLYRYPWFQPAHALYTKWLKEKQDSRYNDALPKTASLTTDRQILMELTETVWEPVAYEKPVAEVISKDDEVEKDKDTEPVETTETLPDNLSYTEWIKFLRNRQPAAPTADEKQKKFALIDKFLAENPRIKPVKSGEIPDIPEAEKSVQPNKMLMTETLARLYVKQKKYEKALDAYEVLRLKYPEKSRYFATRIEEIKLLMHKK